METRAEIERILDRAYAARQKQDVNAVFECFGSDGRFRQNGLDRPAADREAARSALQDLFDAFDLLEFQGHCRVIEPPRAVVYWRGKFRAKQSGEVAETDILDLIEIKDGKIASLTTFFDTALAARLLA